MKPFITHLCTQNNTPDDDAADDYDGGLYSSLFLAISCLPLCRKCCRKLRFLKFLKGILQYGMF